MKMGRYKVVKAPKNYPGKVHSNGYILEHHFIFFMYTGVTIPEEHVLWHKNGDKLDNRIENLEVLPKDVSGIVFAKDKPRKYVQILCSWCKCDIIKPANTIIYRSNKDNFFCSNKCSGHASIKKCQKFSYLPKGKESLEDCVFNVKTNEYKAEEARKAAVKFEIKQLTKEELDYIKAICDYKRSEKKILTEFVCSCGINFTPQEPRQKSCSQKCANVIKRKVARPSKEELTEEIKTNSFIALSKKYKVSDVAIRKWCVFYNIDYKTLSPRSHK